MNLVLLEGVTWDIIIQISWCGRLINYIHVYAMDREAESLRQESSLGQATSRWQTMIDWFFLLVSLFLHGGIW